MSLFALNVIIILAVVLELKTLYEILQEENYHFKTKVNIVWQTINLVGIGYLKTLPKYLFTFLESNS